MSSLCVACVCAGLVLGKPAHATDLDQPVQFDIPAHTPLADALIEWSRVTGTQIMMATQSTANRYTEGVHGVLPPREALARLLKGSDLAYLQEGNTISVAPASRLVQQSSAIQPPQPNDAVAIPTPPPTESSQAGPEPVAVEPPEADKTPAKALEQVVVTGTHIQGAMPASPVIEITNEDIELGGFTTAGQVLQSLPQNFGGGTPQVGGIQGPESTEFSSNLGVTTASLRGLGDATLTLLDGHRLPHIENYNGSDISAIPIGAIDHIEVVPDGASAIYGSDAVAGVINVILKKNYDGAQASATFSNTTSGGADQQTYDVLGGTHWATGRILMTYESQNQQGLFASERPFTRDILPTQTIIPSTHANSATLYVDQSLTDSSAVHLDAAYQGRRGNSYSSGEAAPDVYEYQFPENIEHYAVALSADAALGGAWTAGIDATSAESDDVAPSYTSVDGGPYVAESLYTIINRESSLELHGTGTVVEVPSGSVKSAIGIGYRYETFSSVDEFSSTYDIDEFRRDAYAYGEIELPLIKPDSSRVGLESLSANVSARTDRYSDFGTATNPKVGVVYKVTSELGLRGTYGTSFRAPLLTDLYSGQIGALFQAVDPKFAGGTGNALFVYGGRRNLQPESAHVWTTSVDFTPQELPGLSLTGTYFSYDYLHKIVMPVTVNYNAVPLSDPSLVSSTILFPSAAQIQSFAQNLVPPIFLDGVPGASLDNVEAILDDRYTNASRWTARGVDFIGDYRHATEVGTFSLTLNGSRLFVKDQLTASLPFTYLSGTVFGPPSLKVRGSASWSSGPWTVATFLNYTAQEQDIYLSPQVTVGSFTTIDVHADYKVPPGWGRILDGSRVSLTIQNVGDRAPPYVPFGSASLPGLGYDPTNASPLGRTFVVQLLKSL